MSTGTAPPPSPLERPLSREGRRRLRSRGTNSIGSSGYSSAPGARELRRGRVPFPKPKFPKNHFSVKKGKRRKPKMVRRCACKGASQHKPALLLRVLGVIT